MRQDHTTMKIKRSAHAAVTALLVACTCACGQDTANRQAPASPGAIQAPPTTDPGIVKTPPANVDPKSIERPPSNIDPEIARKPPGEAASGPRVPQSGGKQSREDDCRGPADLCKQDSAR
jgi:hypothetical protein